MISKNVMWSEKYRPDTIEEIVLPESLKNRFRGLIKSRKIPNLLLAGPSGLGKTTVARALAKELDYEVLEISSSLDRSIDTLRNEIKNFASSMDMEGKRRCVILDEADGLTFQTQEALRNFMPKYETNCSFILTANKKHKLHSAIHSRCSVIDFVFRNKEERQDVGKQFVLTALNILKAENVEANKEVVLAFVQKYYPDFRRALNELQTYVNDHGKIDVGILAVTPDKEFSGLLKALHTKSFQEIREWVGKNTLDFEEILSYLFTKGINYMDDVSKPELVLILGKYQYQLPFVADLEIHLTAMLVEIMASCNFKQ